MSPEVMQTRLQYLEKVIDQKVLPFMAKNRDKSGKPGGPPEEGSPGNPPQTPPENGGEMQDPPQAVERNYELKLPRIKVPTEYGLKLVTAEILDADPELLAWMIDKHPDCFTRLPEAPEE